MSAGWHHTCGLKPDGTVECWGRNDDGQSSAPSGSFRAVAAGRWHTCGLRTGNTVVCWGDSARLREAPGPAVVTITVNTIRTPATAVTYTLTVESAARSSQASQQGAPGPGTQRSLDLFELAGMPRPGGGDASKDASGSSSPVRDASDQDVSAACASTEAANAVTVEITDHALRYEIERLLSKSSGEQIASSEMATLTSLSLDVEDSAQGQITDLTGLEHATGLRVLSLYGHGVSDVGPLACLSGLTNLNLARNHISDVAALSGLSGLRGLYLYDNDISDVTALSGLTGLEALYLDYNQISDITALSGLSGLEALGLGDNNITSVAALSGLANLEALYLFDNDIANAGALSGLNSLDTLWIDGNDLASPYGWVPAGGLDYLDARHNLIADIAPLDAGAAPAGIVHSEPQRTATVRVNDASLRAALQAALGKRAGDTLSPAEIATIERLERVGSRSGAAPIADLSGLEHATSLRQLRLGNNAITSIEPIAALGGLETPRPATEPFHRFGSTPRTHVTAVTQPGADRHHRHRRTPRASAVADTEPGLHRHHRHHGPHRAQQPHPAGAHRQQHHRHRAPRRP